jgi:DNA-binding CsgD family transcriptional regulator
MAITKQELQALRRAFRLSPRETELLGLILAGVNADKDLAERLGVTVGTAKQMLQRLFIKVGHSNKLALALAALRELGRL